MAACVGGKRRFKSLILVNESQMDHAKLNNSETIGRKNSHDKQLSQQRCFRPQNFKVLNKSKYNSLRMLP
jgi:hypothetical protein